MCSNWIFAVGNLSGECKFLRKFQWCPICVRVEIALIRNTERSFFVNYITESFKGGGENSGTFVRTDPNPNHAFHLYISTALLYLENRENNCILSAEDRHKVIWHCVVVIADSVTCLLVTEALVLAFININLTVYSCCPLITVASVWTRNINTRTTIARISWQ